MAIAAYYHLSIKEKNTYDIQCQARASIQQWLEERLLFGLDSDYATTPYFNIPPICTKSSLKQYQKKKSSSKKPHKISDVSDKSLLHVTSMTPLNIVSLDDILFVSTLQDDCTFSSTRISQSTKRPMTKTAPVEQQHSSNDYHCQYTQPQEEGEIFAHHTTAAPTSKYAHSSVSNADIYVGGCSKQQRYNHIIQQPQHQPTSYDNFYFHTSSGSSTSSSPSGSFHRSSISLTTNTYEQQHREEKQRRMSYQSDAVSSTELIRRFSSGSTTSTVATSISSTSASAATSTLYVCPANYIVLIDKDDDNRSAQTQIIIGSSTEAHTPKLKIEPPVHAIRENSAAEEEEDCGRDKEEGTNTNVNNLLVGTTLKTREEQKKEHFISSKNNNKNIPNATTTTEPQQKDHDPGHACDTTLSMQQMQHHQQTNCCWSTSSEQQEKKASTNTSSATNALLAYPIWADPIRIQENPSRYEKAIAFLQQHDIPFDSSLPLCKPCTFYFSDNSSTYKKGDNKEYNISAVKSVFTCDSVWQFSAHWRILKDQFNKKPSLLSSDQNLFCFISGVEPMWEDAVNQDGGRFTIMCQQQELDDMFEWLLMTLIGAGFYEDGVVGIVVSKRFRRDRIELWFDSSFHGEECTRLDAFKEKLIGLLPTSCHNEINAGRYKKHFSEK